MKRRVGPRRVQLLDVGDPQCILLCPYNHCSDGLLQRTLSEMLAGITCTLQVQSREQWKFLLKPQAAIGMYWLCVALKEIMTQEVFPEFDQIYRGKALGFDVVCSGGRLFQECFFFRKSVSSLEGFIMRQRAFCFKQYFVCTFACSSGPMLVEHLVAKENIFPARNISSNKY